MSRKNLSKVFKAEAVKLLEESGRPAADVARELGIRRNQLYKWQEQIRAKGEGVFPGGGRTRQGSEEIKRLRKELERVKEERDRMCRVLRVSKSGYYGWQKRFPSARDCANLLLIQKRQVHLETRQTYGSPRVHATLNAKGDRCGRHRVARLMENNQIAAKMTRRFRLAARAKKNNPPPAPNRLQAPFVVYEANRQ